MKLLALLLPFLALYVSAQVLTVEEYMNKCTQCLFSGYDRYYCPLNGLCAASPTDQTVEQCHEQEDVDSGQTVSANWTN